LIDAPSFDAVLESVLLLPPSARSVRVRFPHEEANELFQWCSRDREQVDLLAVGCPQCDSADATAASSKVLEPALVHAVRLASHYDRAIEGAQREIQIWASFAGHELDACVTKRRHLGRKRAGSIEHEQDSLLRA
jgi:hypothetical protein